MTTDRLVDISPKDLTVLRDQYRVNWPEHFIHYRMINNFVHWYSNNTKIDCVSIWSLNDTWRENGTVIIKVHQYIHFATLDPTQISLIRALNLLDWNGNLIIWARMKYISTELLTFFKKSKIPLKIDKDRKVFLVTKEIVTRARPVNVSGITVRRLTPEDVEVVDELWPHKTEGSLNLLKTLAKYNMCLGAFTSTDRLVGWIFISSFGAVGPIHVIDEYRSSRIARSLGFHLAQYIVKSLDLEPFAYISSSNLASITLVEKTGYEKWDEQEHFTIQQIKKSPHSSHQINSKL